MPSVVELYEPLTPEGEARRIIRWRRHLENSLMAFALLGVSRGRREAIV